MSRTQDLLDILESQNAQAIPSSVLGLNVGTSTIAPPINPNITDIGNPLEVNRAINQPVSAPQGLTGLRPLSIPSQAESAVAANRMGVAETDAALAAGQPPPSPSNPFAGLTFEQPELQSAVDRAVESGERFRVRTGAKQFVPFYGRAMDTFALNSVRQSFQRSVEAPITMGPEDWDNIAQYGLALAEAQQEAQGRSGWENVFHMFADIASALPAFAGEIYLTVPFFKLGSARGARGALRALTAGGKVASRFRVKEVLQAVGGNLETAFKFGLTKSQRFGLRASRFAGFGTGTGLQTLANPQLWMQSIQKEMIEDYGFKPNEAEKIAVVLTNPDDTFLDNVVKGFADAYIEIGSENTGPIINAIFSKISSPLVKRLGGMFSSETQRAMKAGIFRRFMQKGVTGARTDKWGDIFARFGFHGIVSEMMEEEVGKAVRAGVGLQDYVVTTVDELIAQGMAFGLPGTSLGILRRSGDLLARVDLPDSESRRLGRELKEIADSPDAPDTPQSRAAEEAEIADPEEGAAGIDATEAEVETRVAPRPGEPGQPASGQSESGERTSPTMTPEGGTIESDLKPRRLRAREIKQVRKQFPDSTIRAKRGTLEVELANGKTLRVIPVKELNANSIPSLREQAELEGGGSFRGLSLPLEGSALEIPGLGRIEAHEVILLAHAADVTTIPHEAMHAAVRVGLSDSEARVLYDEFAGAGSEPGDSADDEAVAEAYERFGANEFTHPLLSKIQRAFRHMFNTFFRPQTAEAEAIFAQLPQILTGSQRVERALGAAATGAFQRGDPGTLIDRHFSEVDERIQTLRFHQTEHYVAGRRARHISGRLHETIKWEQEYGNPLTEAIMRLLWKRSKVATGEDVWTIVVDGSPGDSKRAIASRKASIHGKQKKARTKLFDNEMPLPWETLDAAMRVGPQARYWYENWEHLLKTRFPDMLEQTRKDMSVLLAATSPKTKVIQNMLKALSLLNAELRNLPAESPIMIPEMVESVIREGPFGDNQHKIGSFLQTYLFCAGLSDKPPLPVLDVIMSKAFGIPDGTFGKGIAYEAFSRYIFELTSEINKRLPPGAEPWQAWQLQAAIWHVVNSDPNTFETGLEQAMNQMESAGIKLPFTIHDDERRRTIPMSVLIDNDLQPILETAVAVARNASIATVSAATANTTLGRQGVSLVRQLSSITPSLKKDQTTTAQLLNQYDKIMHTTLRQLHGNRERHRPWDKKPVMQVSLMADLAFAINGIKVNPTTALATMAQPTEDDKGKRVGPRQRMPSAGESYMAHNGMVEPVMRIPLATSTFTPENRQTFLAQVAIWLGGTSAEASQVRPLTEGDSVGGTQTVGMYLRGVTPNRGQINAMERFLVDRGFSNRIEIDSRPATGSVVYLRPDFENAAEVPDGQVLADAVGIAMDSSVTGLTMNLDYRSEREYDSTGHTLTNSEIVDEFTRGLLNAESTEQWVSSLPKGTVQDTFRRVVGTSRRELVAFHTGSLSEWEGKVPPRDINRLRAAYRQSRVARLLWVRREADSVINKFRNEPLEAWTQEVDTFRNERSARFQPLSRRADLFMSEMTRHPLGEKVLTSFHVQSPDAWVPIDLVANTHGPTGRSYLVLFTQAGWTAESEEDKAIVREVLASNSELKSNKAVDDAVNPLFEAVTKLTGEVPGSGVRFAQATPIAVYGPLASTRVMSTAKKIVANFGKAMKPMADSGLIEIASGDNFHGPMKVPVHKSKKFARDLSVHQDQVKAIGFYKRLAKQELGRYPNLAPMAEDAGRELEIGGGGSFTPVKEHGEKMPLVGNPVVEENLDNSEWKILHKAIISLDSGKLSEWNRLIGLVPGKLDTSDRFNLISMAEDDLGEAKHLGGMISSAREEMEELAAKGTPARRPSSRYREILLSKKHDRFLSEIGWADIAKSYRDLPGDESARFQAPRKLARVSEMFPHSVLTDPTDRASSRVPILHDPTPEQTNFLLDNMAVNDHVRIIINKTKGKATFFPGFNSTHDFVSKGLIKSKAHAQGDSLIFMNMFMKDDGTTTLFGRNVPLLKKITGVARFQPSRREGPEIRGEYWLEDGEAHFADGDVGDVNHEMMVIERAMNEVAEAVADTKYAGFADAAASLADDPIAAREELLSWFDAAQKSGEITEEEANDPQAAVVKETGLDEQLVDVAFDNVDDARVFGMTHYGMARMAGNNIQIAGRYNRGTLKSIADGIETALEQEGFEEDAGPFFFNLEDDAAFYMHVPLDVIKAGDMKALRDLNTRTGGGQFQAIEYRPTSAVARVLNDVIYVSSDFAVFRGDVELVHNPTASQLRALVREHAREVDPGTMSEGVRGFYLGDGNSIWWGNPHVIHMAFYGSSPEQAESSTNHAITAEGVEIPLLRQNREVAIELSRPTDGIVARVDRRAVPATEIRKMLKKIGLPEDEPIVEDVPFAPRFQRMRGQPVSREEFERNQARQAAGEEIGRPELAEPLFSDDANTAMRSVDEAMKAGGEPIVRHDAEVWTKAGDMVKKDPEGTLAELMEVINSGGVLDDVQTWAARLLTDQATIPALKDQDPAKLKPFLALATAYRRMRSEAGRALRMGREFDKDPASRHHRIITEAVVHGTPTEQRKLDEVTTRIGETAGEEREAAVAERERLLDAQAKRIAKINDRLKELGLDLTNPDIDWASIRLTAKALRTVQTIHATGFDMMYEFWINAILSAPATHARNITGNTAFTAWEFTVQRLAEILVNKILPGTATQKARSATLAEFRPMLQAHLASWSKAASNAVTSWDTEQSTFADELRGGGSAKIEKTERRAAIPGLLGRIVRAPVRFLLAADEFAKTMTGSMHVQVVAHRMARAEGKTGTALAARVAELVNNPFSKAWTEAINEAKRLTFQSDMGRVGNAILKARREWPALRFIVPFVTTPLNIFGIGLKKSPLGAARLIWKVLNGTEKREQAVVDVAEQVLAWGIMLALMPYIIPDEEDGLPRITGTTPEGWGERELAYRAAPPMSIRMADGFWLSYAGIEPASVALATVVDGIHNFHTAKTSQEAGAVLGRAINSLVGQVSNKTFLRGLSDVFEVIKRPAKGIPRWGINFASSWVPNIVRSAAREADDMIRIGGVQAEDMGAFWTKAALRTGQKAVPLEAIAPPAKVDLWGNEITRFNGLPYTDWAYRMFVPFRRFKTNLGKTGDLDRMMVNWNNAHPDEILAPRPPRMSFTVRGKSIFMTDQEYHDFMLASGQRATRLVENMPFNVDNPTVHDRKRLERVMRNARSIERKRLIHRLVRAQDPRLTRR